LAIVPAREVRPAFQGASVMAFSSTVDQITDSVAQTGTELLGDAPAVAMANLYVATSQALALAAHNATAAQQSGGELARAATALSVAWLHSLSPRKKAARSYA
jgi:hypothetical protein